MLRELLWFLAIFLIVAALVLEMMSQSIAHIETATNSSEMYKAIVRRDNLHNAATTLLLSAVAVTLSPTLATIED
jgi:ABC-type spermidine/putrescine transport system permease subunit I